MNLDEAVAIVQPQTDLIRVQAKLATVLSALDGMVLVCGRTGDRLEDFEEQAAAFKKDTGLMRPGKDMPAAYGGDDNIEVRREKYDKWVKRKIEVARAALSNNR